MINVLSPPPEILIINEKEYVINSDFRVWLEITELLQSLDVSCEGEEVQQRNYELVINAALLAFGEIIDEPIKDILRELEVFLRGYPYYDNGYIGSEEAGNDRIYSFTHDINFILLAIRNQSGIDLTYKGDVKHFHWWDFLLEFQSLEERHYISKIMSYRGYKGEDKEYLRVKKVFALPAYRTVLEEKQAYELNDIFYDC